MKKIIYFLFGLGVLALAIFPVVSSAYAVSQIQAPISFQKDTPTIFVAYLNEWPNKAGVLNRITVTGVDLSEVNSLQIKVDGAFINLNPIQDGADVRAYDNHLSQNLTFAFSLKVLKNVVVGYALVDNSSGSEQILTSSSVPVNAAQPAAQPALQVLGEVSYNFTRYLYRGLRGEDVKQLQNILIVDGYLNAQPTGFFGPLTAAAVKMYQSKHGLPVTGTVGPLTRKSLQGK